MPCVRAAPGRQGAAGRTAVSAWTLSSASGLLLDPRHDAVARIEEAAVDLRPAAEELDREQLRPDRKREAAGCARDDRAIAVLREDLLRRRRAQVTDERVRSRLVLRV